MQALNFNNYTYQETQFCGNSADFTFTNAPTTMSGLFQFINTAAFQNASAQQIIIMTSSSVIYTRSYDGNAETFGDWVTIAGVASFADAPTTLAGTSTTTVVNPAGLKSSGSLSSGKGTAYVTGFTSAGVTAAALPISGGTSTFTNNLAANSTTGVTLTLSRQFDVSVTLDLTSSATSGATFTITGANCTVTTKAKAIGASATGYMTLSAVVTTTGTAGPVITVVASSVTGTVAVAADSVIKIVEL